MATGDLVFQPSYQGSFGTERMRLSGAGVLTVGGVTITGASGIATASLFQFSPSRGFMRATADGVFDFEINSGGDFGRITLGGSSSFPAIKRNGAGIDVRLGDDSGYAPIAASAYSAGATAGASCTITGATAHLTVVNGIVTLCN
jgi:hypothetical protein